MRLGEQARSVWSKLSVMANAEVNERIEKDGKSVSSGEEDENALLAEDGNDHDTTGAHAIAPFNYEKLFKDCKRKLVFWRERQTSPMPH